MGRHVAFKPGHKKPAASGLKKGGLTRDKLSMREFLNAKNINIVEQFLARAFACKDPGESAQLIALCFPYVYPKLSAVEITNKTNYEIELEQKSQAELVDEVKQLFERKGITYGQNTNGENQNGVSRLDDKARGDLLAREAILEREIED